MNLMVTSPWVTVTVGLLSPVVGLIVLVGLRWLVKALKAEMTGNREQLKDDIQAKHDAVMTEVTQIKTQTTATNGRVTTIEGKQSEHWEQFVALKATVETLKEFVHTALGTKEKP